MSSSSPAEGLVTIGRIVRPQGRKGEVVTEVLSDRPDRFRALRRAFVVGPEGPREVTVTSSWPHKKRWVLKLEGVDSIDAAEAYRGLDLGLPEAELPALPDGAYYHHQLLGLEVVSSNGEGLGRVTSLLETGGDAKVLVVQDDGRETMIPLAASFIRRIDLGSGRIEVLPHEWVDAGH